MYGNSSLASSFPLVLGFLRYLGSEQTSAHVVLQLGTADHGKFSGNSVAREAGSVEERVVRIPAASSYGPVRARLELQVSSLCHENAARAAAKLPTLGPDQAFLQQLAASPTLGCLRSAALSGWRQRRRRR